MVLQSADWTLVIATEKSGSGEGSLVLALALA
jgi:hypothetical protein